MRIFFLILFFIPFFSCTKNEKKEIPVKNIQAKDTLVPIETEVVEEDRLVFTVQIAALKKPNKALDKLENVHVFQENSLTKYRLGHFKTYKEVRAQRAQCIKKYKGAFVQALLNGAPISITEALQ